MVFVYAAVAVLYVFLGAFALIQNAGSRVNRVFIVSMLIFAAWSLVAALRTAAPSPSVESSWRIVSALAGLLGSASILHFILLLAGKGGSAGLRPLVLAVVYLPAAALYLAVFRIGFFAAAPGDLVIARGSILVLAYYSAALLAGAVTLAAWGRRTRKPRERRQSGIILAALVPSMLAMALSDTVLPAILARVSADLASGYARLYLFPIIPLAWSAAMWLAITRYRLLALSPDLAAEEIMDNILDLLLLLDEEGRILEVNAQVERTLSRSREQLLRRPFVEIVDEKAELGKVLEEIATETRPGHRGEATLLAAEDRIPVRIAAAAVKDGAGELLGLVIAAQDIRLEKRFEILSKTDRLTGLHNRARLDEVLEYELHRFRRSGQPFCACIADLDRFKLVNDELGHQAGDGVLRELARTLAAGIRVTDTLGRWGGEEFLLVLPETSAAGALMVVEKLRERVEASDFRIGRRVTASFGFDEVRSGDSADSLLSRADEALYAAKRAGRNRACAYRDAGEPSAG